MKYLLFVYPCDETWDSEKMNEVIADELSVITKTDIKYLFGKKHSIFHFDTTLSIAEVREFIELLKDDVSEFMYFITQSSKNCASNMEEDSFLHLMSVKPTSKKSKKENPITGFFKENFDEKLDAEIIRQMELNFKMAQEVMKNETSNLTIDEILDKIIDQGIDSLTKGEKRKLDEYSKQ